MGRPTGARVYFLKDGVYPSQADCEAQGQIRYR